MNVANSISNNFLISVKGDWIRDTEGCSYTRNDRYFVTCDCNHLSFFGVLVVSLIDLQDASEVCVAILFCWDTEYRSRGMCDWTNSK